MYFYCNLQTSPTCIALHILCVDLVIGDMDRRAFPSGVNKTSGQACKLTQAGVLVK